MHKCVNVVSPGISDLCEFHRPVLCVFLARPTRVHAIRFPYIRSESFPIERPIPPRDTEESRLYSFPISPLLNRPLDREGVTFFRDDRGDQPPG